VHDTSDGEDSSDDNIMHVPDVNDIGCDDITDNVLQAKSISGNNEDSMQRLPELSTPSPAASDNPTFSAPPLPKSPGSVIPAQGPPDPPEAAAAELPMIETNDDHQFSLDGPAMCIGRKQKARDLPSILQVCMCGNTVNREEKASHECVIECKAVGCETGWVRIEMLIKIGWDSQRYSIIFNALGSTTV
jgi:hypothetical protein